MSACLGRPRCPNVPARVNVAAFRSCPAFPTTSLGASDPLITNIIIKNRYALSLILELMDRLRGKKYYMKLDLCGAYNLIYMREGEE